jgi:hypothetical protein
MSKTKREGNVISSKRHKKVSHGRKIRSLFQRGEEGKSLTCSSFRNDWHENEVGMARRYFGGFQSNE